MPSRGRQRRVAVRAIPDPGRRSHRVEVTVAGWGSCPSLAVRHRSIQGYLLRERDGIAKSHCGQTAIGIEWRCAVISSAVGQLREFRQIVRPIVDQREGDDVRSGRDSTVRPARRLGSRSLRRANRGDTPSRFARGPRLSWRRDRCRRPICHVGVHRLPHAPGLRWLAGERLGNAIVGGSLCRDRKAGWRHSVHRACNASFIRGRTGRNRPAPFAGAGRGRCDMCRDQVGLRADAR